MPIKPKEMVSLLKPKLTKKELEEKHGTVPSEIEDQDRYPYGTRLSFEKDEIAKIKALQGVAAGANVMIYAKGQVKEVRIVDSDKDSRKRERVEIQVTDIGILANMRREDMSPAEYREDREGK